MCSQIIVAASAAALIVLTAAVVQRALSQTRSATPPALATELRPAASFAGIGDPRARSVALFGEAGKVLTHPRCVNCHPASDRPGQTDRMRPHEPLVVRGADGHGVPGMACNTCHGNANYDPAQVPGDPHWHLAPASMALEGRSVGQICEQIKDPSRNGNRDIPAILRHVAEDSLILWAWSPGAGRTPAPGTNAEFAGLMRAWADAGAHCPAP
jgi:hypothetical protein